MQTKLNPIKLKPGLGVLMQSGYELYWAPIATTTVGCMVDWLRGTEVQRPSLAGELSLSCARPAADG